MARPRRRSSRGRGCSTLQLKHYAFVFALCALCRCSTRDRTYLASSRSYIMNKCSSFTFINSRQEKFCIQLFRNRFSIRSVINGFCIELKRASSPVKYLPWHQFLRIIAISVTQHALDPGAAAVAAAKIDSMMQVERLENEQMAERYSNSIRFLV